MQTIEKTFRYTYILKNLGLVYLLFLAIGTWLTFAFDGFITFPIILLGVGVLGIVLYLTTSVTISNEDVSARTLTGSRTLRWSEIGVIKSTSSFFKLINVDGDTSIRINSRLDGYAQIFGLIYQKRGDLFDVNKTNSFSKKVIKHIVALLFSALMVIFFVLLFIFSKDFKFVGLSIVFGLSVFYELNGLLFTPESITIEENAVTLKYFNKTNSCSRDDIALIAFDGSHVSIIKKDNSHITVSDFPASPFVIYFVLKRWFEKPTTMQASL